MRKRLIVAVIFIPLLLAIIYLCPPIMLTVAVAILSAIGVHEVLSSTGMVSNIRFYGYGMIFAAVIPFWFYFDGGAALGFFGMFLFICLIFAETLYSGGEVKIGAICATIFFSLFIPVTLAGFVRLRGLAPWQFSIILPIVIAFTSDAGGLFAGMFFGKHKLAPSISPKKTIEGAIGAVVVAAICSVLTGIVAQAFMSVTVNYLALIVYGVLGSIISQFGDLCFSYIKREFQIKDFGRIFPGHGGVLDRFDSVIFCVPFVEMLFFLWPAFSVTLI